MAGIFIGVGSNLALPGVGYPKSVLEAALDRLGDAGCEIVERSPWFRSAPVPISDQPEFINGVVGISTMLEPDALLRALLAVEAEFGRERQVGSGARTLDLDILTYDGLVIGADGDTLCLPHPRMHLRAFVLLPLRVIAPDWRHPVLGVCVDALVRALPGDQFCVELDPP